MWGDLPPNSRDTFKRVMLIDPKDLGLRNYTTFFKLLLAAASMTLRPVTVDPVNATLSTSMWADKAAPPIDPREGIVFTTPGGKLAQN
jgi:hypothetical protein